MKAKNMKKIMDEHISRKSLSDDQLDLLMSLQGIKKDVAPGRPSVRYRWVASIIFVVTVLLTTLYFNLATNLSLDARIGAEVAKNHIKLKPLEVQSSDLGVLRKYFTELDFTPIESALIKPLDKTLLGGRYCSIQGVTAAQLRLKDNKTGQIQSLYETIYTPDIFKNLPKLEEGQAPITVYSGGLEVDIWVEKGILFALTRDTQ